MSYERITIVGNIGNVEVLSSKAGTPYFRMSVAVERGSSATKSVNWYSVLLFGAMAKDEARLTSLYQKGRLVLIEGRPQVEAYIRKDGNAGLDNTIVAISMPELLDSKSRGH